METTTPPNTPYKLRDLITERRLKIRRRIERFFNLYTNFTHALSLLLIMLGMFCGQLWQRYLFGIFLIAYIIMDLWHPVKKLYRIILPLTERDN